MKRSLLLASFLIGFVILLGAGCQQTQPINQKDQMNNVSGTNETSSTNTQKIFTIQGLKATVPDKYSVVKVEVNKVWIKTDDIKYDVKLVLEIKKEDNRFYEQNANEEPGENLPLKEGELFEVNSTAGAFRKSGLVVSSGIYSFVWTVETDQPRPKDQDVPWVPNTKVIQNDLLNIEKTIEVVKK